MKRSAIKSAILSIILAVTVLAAVSCGSSNKQNSDTSVTSTTSAGSATLENRFGLKLEISLETGAYKISFNGEKWIGEGIVAMRLHDEMLLNIKPDGSPSGQMKVLSNATGNGEDSSGPFKAVLLTWDAQGFPFETEFRVYADIPQVQFLQTFPDGFEAEKTFEFADTSLNFPVFVADDSGSGKNLFGYNYRIWPQPRLGKNVAKTLSAWKDQIIMPVMVFDEAGRTGILSSFGDYMIRVVRGLDLTDAGFGPAVAVGLNGELERLEEGHITQSILHFNNEGINAAIDSFGDRLLAEGGKKQVARDATFFIKYLGYWTDNGAYYYYRTEPGKNYETTLLDLADYLRGEKIPVRHIQLDSWWYPKSEIDNGLLRWEPNEDMFPDGLESFQKKLGMPLTFHNRYFATDTVYQQTMPFVRDTSLEEAENLNQKGQGSGPAARDHGGVQPLDRQVFDHWAENLKKWDGVMYEQDWLGTQVFRVNAMRRDPGLASAWLRNMNDAMAEREIDIQYCMPTILFYFESTKLQNVSNIRSSGDYDGHIRGTSHHLWWEHVYTSPMIAAVGAYPYKDVFITNPPDREFDSVIEEKNYTYSGDKNDKFEEDAHIFEPYNHQNALLSILSAGPVGIGDRIGDVYRPIVMLMADEEGSLVKPDRPLIPIDAMYYKDPYDEQIPLVAYSQSKVSDRTWYYVLALNINQLMLAGNVKLEFNRSDIPLTGDYVLYDFKRGRAKKLTEDFTYKAKLPHSYHEYLVLAPLSEQGRALIGDAGKYVTASGDRIASWSDTESGMTIELNGPQASETKLLIYSETAPTAANAGKTGALSWKPAGNDLYTIELPGGAGEQVTVNF